MWEEGFGEHVIKRKQKGGGGLTIGSNLKWTSRAASSSSCSSSDSRPGSCGPSPRRSSRSALSSSGTGSWETKSQEPPPPLPPTPASVSRVPLLVVAAGCRAASASASSSSPSSPPPSPFPPTPLLFSFPFPFPCFFRPSTKTLTRPAQLLVVTRPGTPLTSAIRSRIPASTLPLGDASAYSAAGAARRVRIAAFFRAKPDAGPVSVPVSALPGSGVPVPLLFPRLGIGGWVGRMACCARGSGCWSVMNNGG